MDGGSQCVLYKTGKKKKTCVIQEEGGWKNGRLNEAEPKRSGSDKCFTAAK